MEINTVCGFLCLASAFFIRKKKTKPASNFPDAQEMTCGRGWGGAVVIGWPTPCLLTVLPAFSTCWLRALNLENEAHVAETLPCFSPSCSAELLPYSHLLASCSLPSNLILALLCSGGKAAGQSTVLSREGFHRRHCPDDLGVLHQAAVFKRGVVFCFFFFPWDFPFFTNLCSLPLWSFQQTMAQRKGVVINLEFITKIRGCIECHKPAIL